MYIYTSRSFYRLKMLDNVLVIPSINDGNNLAKIAMNHNKPWSKDHNLCFRSKIMKCHYNKIHSTLSKNDWVWNHKIPWIQKKKKNSSHQFSNFLKTQVFYYPDHFHSIIRKKRIRWNKNPNLYVYKSPSSVINFLPLHKYIKLPQKISI